MAKQLPQPGGEDLGLGEEFEVAIEAELALGKGALQSGHELAAKHSAQHSVGKREGAAGWDPACVIGGQTPGGEYAMDVGMKLELLVPGMQYAEEADLGAQMFRIEATRAEFGRWRGTGDRRSVSCLQSQWRQLPRQSEHDMHVRGG